MKLAHTIQKKPLVFIGFMGVGKTTIAREVARRLGRGFVDIDEEIEKVYGTDIPTIFAKHGQAHFRETEQELIYKWCTESKRVVSLGGGAFLKEETRQFCLEKTTVVHLHMPWEEWKERLPALRRNRPNLQGKTIDEVEALFMERIPIYEDYHVRVEITKDSSIQEITDAVIEELRYLT